MTGFRWLCGGGLYQRPPPTTRGVDEVEGEAVEGPASSDDLSSSIGHGRASEEIK